MFTGLGKVIATLGTLYSLFDLVYIPFFQYSAFLEEPFRNAFEAGRAAANVGMIEDVRDALSLLAFSVTLGVLTEISSKLSKRSE